MQKAVAHKRFRIDLHVNDAAIHFFGEFGGSVRGALLRIVTTILYSLILMLVKEGVQGYGSGSFPQNESICVRFKVILDLG